MSILNEVDLMVTMLVHCLARVEVRLKLVFSSSLDACFSFIDTAGDFIKKFSENNTMTDFPIYDISSKCLRL